MLRRWLRAAPPDVDLTVVVHRDRHHRFHSARPVRFRPDVANGTGASGVRAGGNPAARAQSRHEVDAFFTRILK